jgi:hypothetical protein
MFRVDPKTGCPWCYGRLVCPIKAPAPELDRLQTVELTSNNLREIGCPIWTFDGAGVLAQEVRFSIPRR